MLSKYIEISKRIAVIVWSENCLDRYFFRNCMDKELCGQLSLWNCMDTYELWDLLGQLTKGIVWSDEKSNIKFKHP